MFSVSDNEVIAVAEGVHRHHARAARSTPKKLLRQTVEVADLEASRTLIDPLTYLSWKRARMVDPSRKRSTRSRHPVQDLSVFQTY